MYEVCIVCDQKAQDKIMWNAKILNAKYLTKKIFARNSFIAFRLKCRALRLEKMSRDANGVSLIEKLSFLLI